MRILLTNDDGIVAPGLAALCRFFAREHEVFVVAPDNERSGVSQSITYRRPVFHKRHSLPANVVGLAINGFPVDCVKVALHSLCPWVPDLVVSGINAGLNIGLNVGHSGTVSAALAASAAGLPAVAISLEEAPEMDFDTAIERAWPICEDLLNRTSLHSKVLNINVPTAALTGTCSYAVVPVNCNNMGYHFLEGIDPKGRPWLWQTNEPAPQQLREPCDVSVCRDGGISVSPLAIDLTCHSTLQKLGTQAVEQAMKPDNLLANGVSRTGAKSAELRSTRHSSERAT